jgi:hypothetical protein
MNSGLNTVLLKSLKYKAIKKGLIRPDAEIDAGTAFTLVRDMPYIRASSRDPETTIWEWRGARSGKHYLLKALFGVLWLSSRLMACTKVVHIDPAEVMEKVKDRNVMIHGKGDFLVFTTVFQERL